MCTHTHTVVREKMNDDSEMFESQLALHLGSLVTVKDSWKKNKEKKVLDIFVI